MSLWQPVYHWAPTSSHQGRLLQTKTCGKCAIITIHIIKPLIIPTITMWFTDHKTWVSASWPMARPNLQTTGAALSLLAFRGHKVLKSCTGPATRIDPWEHVWGGGVTNLYSTLNNGGKMKDKQRGRTRGACTYTNHYWEGFRGVSLAFVAWGLVISNIEDTKSDPELGKGVVGWDTSTPKQGAR